jgi:glycosyltransferase involved in cell wall biosynthesis
LQNISFKPYQPLERLAESLSVGDIHLISLRPELEGLIVPSKFYGVLAAGRASVFVGDPNGELAKTILKYEIGRVHEPGQAAALAHGIVQYADNPQLCDATGVRARALFEKRFSMANSLKTWESILRFREASS